MPSETTTAEATAPAARQEPSALWRFFANVKLGVFWLILLGALSVIGTVIPQTTGQVETLQGYVARIGPDRAALYSRLGLLDVYHAWWFNLVLVLMCTSIMVASFDRWPRIYKDFSRDEPVPPPARFESSPLRGKWRLPAAYGRLEDFKSLFTRFFGAPQVSHTGEREAVLYSNRGKWTRVGVFVVHAGILITAAGAVLDGYAGFKNGQMFIREGASSRDFLILRGVSPTGEVLTDPRTLPFAVRCDDFEVQFYTDPRSGETTKNPKLFRSRLTIVEDGRERVSRDIFVNDPLRYGGYTFYQASYQAAEPTVHLEAVGAKTGEVIPLTVRLQQSFKVAGDPNVYVPGFFEENFTHQETGALGPALGIEIQGKSEKDGGRFLVFRNYPNFDKERGAKYFFRLVRADQPFFTGLQIAVSPGTPVIYTGCFLLLYGMLLAFFLSHRQSWLKVTAEGVSFAGLAYKHRLAYEGKARAFEEALEKEFPAARPAKPGR